MHAPVASHELQIGFWNQVMLDSHGVEFKVQPEQQHLEDTEAHHHILALVHGVQANLDHVYGEGKKKLEVMYSAEGFDRAIMRVVEGGYLAVEEAATGPVFSVDVSYYVYPENLTSHKGAKKDAKVGDDSEGDDDEKGQKLLLKTEACIPVVFKVDDKTYTRHYQESMPMHKHVGMTNRLLKNLVNEVQTFLIGGDLPQEPK